MTRIEEQIAELDNYEKWLSDDAFNLRLREAWRTWLRDAALRSANPQPAGDAVDYGCGTFDSWGLCINCRKKISDLNEWDICPFGKYPAAGQQNPAGKK